MLCGHLRGSRDNSIYFCTNNINDIRPLVDLNFEFIEEDIERLWNCYEYQSFERKDIKQCSAGSSCQVNAVNGSSARERHKRPPDEDIPSNQCWYSIQPMLNLTEKYFVFRLRGTDWNIPSTDRAFDADLKQGGFFYLNQKSWKSDYCWKQHKMGSNDCLLWRSWF